MPVRNVLFVLLLIVALPLWAGPEIESWETSGGARVLYVHAPELPMIDIRVVFDAGSARDDKLPGLAMLTNGVMTDGAGAWNADQVAERMEAVGAELSAGARKDMAWVSIRSLTEPAILETAIETLTATLAEPRFENGDIERSRRAMQISLRRGEESPGTVAKKAFYKSVFGKHPYATNSGGVQESLKRISREQILGFHKQYYVAKNAVLAIVGAVDRKQAQQLAERLAAGLPAGVRAAKIGTVEALTDANLVDMPFPSSQSHILMGQPGMRRGDPDYFVLYLGNHILGGGGLVSLLTEEIREKRGLSYSVYSYFSPMRQNGPFIIGAQTQNAKVDEALTVIRETLQRYIDQGPTEAELTAAKQNITGGFPLKVASNSDIVQYLAMIGFYDLPLDYLDAFVGKIDAITREQVQDAFKRRLQPDRMVTVVVGNGAKQGG
ncbi:MAG: insulinase family protein [Gammaproteobacteria bacterium]|nr:insulinase family protein [Gammaproteobacteria bacterium]